MRAIPKMLMEMVHMRNKMSCLSCIAKNVVINKNIIPIHIPSVFELFLSKKGIPFLRRLKRKGMDARKIFKTPVIGIDMR